MRLEKAKDAWELERSSKTYFESYGNVHVDAKRTVLAHLNVLGIGRSLMDG